MSGVWQSSAYDGINGHCAVCGTGRSREDRVELDEHQVLVDEQLTDTDGKIGDRGEIDRGPTTSTGEQRGAAQPA